MLCLIVHGSEQDNAKPFKLKNGELWELPKLPLPPLVLLLVCGSDSGNLIDYGNTLLQSGAQTVLASVGKLDAQPSAKFLIAFLKQWLDGLRVSEILLKAQAEPNSELAAQRLQLLGRGDLRINSDYAHNPDELSFIVNSITLSCFQDQGNLYKAVDLLKIPHSDAKAKQLLQQLDKIQIWELSQYWIIPLIVYLAERYDHKLLKKYELKRSKLNKYRQALSPAIYHYWAKLYYRQGRYDLAVKETVDGLCLLTPDKLYTLGEGLLGHLINLLVDLNLPKEGMLLCDRLDEYLAKQQTKQAKTDHHKLLDRAARLALKQNRSYKAISKYKNKQEESIELYNETGERELAWLLYVTAFLKYKQAPDYAKQVKNILTNEDKIRENLNKDKGNANGLYLIRALSLWAWRANDFEAVNLLKRYKDILCNRSTLLDTGPLNFSIIYLYLYFRQSPKSKFDLPPLEEVFEKLEQHRYWFELAALGSLLNEPERQRWLRKFHQQRQGVISHLEKLPAWLRDDGQDWNWQESVKQQELKESEVLLGDTAASVERLIEAGLLPL